MFPLTSGQDGKPPCLHNSHSLTTLSYSSSWIYELCVSSLNILFCSWSYTTIMFILVIKACPPLKKCHINCLCKGSCLLLVHSFLITIWMQSKRNWIFCACLIPLHACFCQDFDTVNKDLLHVDPNWLIKGEIHCKTASSCWLEQRLGRHTPTRLAVE